MEAGHQKNEEEKEIRVTGQPKTLTMKQNVVILDQQQKSLCQIKIGEKKATGFLCKISDHPVLITNNHVINENLLEPGKEIKICFTDAKQNPHYKTIKIDTRRTTYTADEVEGINIDTTIIELYPNEDGLKDQKFMELDDQLMTEDVYDIYAPKDIYLIHYKDGEEVALSIGEINDDSKNEINSVTSYDLLHTCDTGKGSSGSPIILYNHKIIGVHRGRIINSKFNIATMLQYPVKNL